MEVISSIHGRKYYFELNSMTHLNNPSVQMLCHAYTLVWHNFDQVISMWIKYSATKKIVDWHFTAIETFLSAAIETFLSGVFLHVFILVELGVSLYSLYVIERSHSNTKKIAVQLLNSETVFGTSMSQLVRLQNKCSMASVSNCKILIWDVFSCVACHSRYDRSCITSQLWP